MAAALRPFLVLLLALTLFGGTAFVDATSLIAEPMVAAEPCCEGDCPDNEVCEASCALMQRCSYGMSALAQVPEPAAMAAPKVVTLLPDDQKSPRGFSPHGLRRPPRT